MGADVNSTTTRSDGGGLSHLLHIVRKYLNLSFLDECLFAPIGEFSS